MSEQQVAAPVSAAPKDVPEYTTNFLNSLGIMKVGAILFFLLVTAVYQYKFHSVKQANTLLATKKTKGNVMLDSTITGLLGVISIMAVFYIREGALNIRKYLKAYVYVFIILYLFTFAQESSGFNRFRAEKETAKGEGPYAEIDGTAVNGKPDPEGIKKFKSTEQPGDYFMTAVAYTCFVIIAFACVYFIMRMFASSWKGMSQHPISEAFGTDASGTSMKFMMEVLALVVINGVAPFISAKLRGEKILGKSTLEMTGVVVVVSAVLHFMFQWAGVYDLGHAGWNKMDLVVIGICILSLVAYSSWSFGKK